MRRELSFLCFAASAIFLIAPEAAAVYQAAPVFAPDDGEVEVIWTVRGAPAGVTLRLTSFDANGAEIVLTEVNTVPGQEMYRFCDRRARGGRPTTYRLISVDSGGAGVLIGVVTCFDPTMSEPSSESQLTASSGIPAVPVSRPPPTMPWRLHRSHLRTDAGGSMPCPEPPVPRRLRPA